MTERAALYLAADGRCAECGAELQPGWHSDHVVPYSRGGATDVINGQALCPPCNLRKGDRFMQLRDWQQEAREKFRASGKRDFLVCATPGAGKTRAALYLAREALDEGSARRVAVVVPTDELRNQWAEEAGAFGLDLMPVNDPADYEKAGYVGCVVTYAQLAGAGADLLRRAMRTPTFAILDEVHHAGDQRAWGEGVKRGLDRAVRRLALTGTPWRNDKASPIPFVEYDEAGKVMVDVGYEYGAAVADGVCRRIEFHAYDGEASWIDPGSSRRVVSVKFGDRLAVEDEAGVLDTILHPEREWMPGVVSAAVDALRELRQEVPDAGGLLVCDRRWQAEKYAAMLRDLTGEDATVVLSEDAQAAGKIDRFRKGRSAWLVAIRMVSEGVDIKRLAVGVYATNYRTPLFFRQVVGRFVRTRPGEELNARLYIPAVPTLMGHAREIEDELRHQLDLAREEDEKAQQAASNEQRTYELRTPLSASDPRFQSSIFGGEQNSAEVRARAVEWCRKRGIPEMYAPNVIADILAEGQATATVTVAPNPSPAPRLKRERALRDEINALAGKVGYAERIPKKEVNERLFTEFGPRSKCSVETLEKMHAYLVAWLAEVKA